MVREEQHNVASCNLGLSVMDIPWYQPANPQIDQWDSSFVVFSKTHTAKWEMKYSPIYLQPIAKIIWMVESNQPFQKVKS